MLGAIIFPATSRASEPGPPQEATPALVDASRSPSGATTIVGIADHPFQADERKWAVSLNRQSYLAVSHLDEAPQSTLQNDGTAWGQSEVNFQLSIKAPLLRQILNGNNALYFGYTNRSWWQLWEKSGPFREINHEPELFLRTYLTDESASNPNGWLGFDLGLNHQSNGKAGEESRSWNRVIAAAAYRANNLLLMGRVWSAFSEDDEFNPHLHRYLGYGEARVVYMIERAGRGPINVSLMYRPGTDKSAIESTISYALENTSVRLYAQYFDGYGESLLDYDQRTRRITLGVAFNDFLSGNGREPSSSGPAAPVHEH